MFGNLSIRSKLLGLLAVPVAATVLLGVTGVTAASGDRTRAGAERRAAQDGQAELRNRRRRVDAALAAYRTATTGLGTIGEPALGQAVATATERLDRLALARVEVDRRLVTPELAMAGHDAMANALLRVTRGLAARVEAPEPARSARLLLALTAAKEATGQERVVLAAAPPEPRPPTSSSGCAWPPPPRWPARSSTASGRSPAPGWERSTVPSASPASATSEAWSWPCSTRPSAGPTPATWAAGGPG